MKSVKNVVNTGEIKTYLLKSMVKRSKITKQAFALIKVYIVKYIEKEGDLMKRKNKKSFNWYGLRQRFSIRKYHFGAASVLIGTTMFLMGGPTTQAAETGTQIVQSTDSSSTGKAAEDVTNKQVESQTENTSNKQDEAKANSSSSSTSTPEVTAKEKVDTTSNGSNEVITQPKAENQEEKAQEEKTTATVSTDALRTYLDELKNLLKEVPDSLKEKVENQEKVAEKAEKLLDSETSTQQEVDEQVDFVRTSINSLKKLKENNWGLDSKDKAEDKSEKEIRNPKERSANITPKEKLEKLSQSLNTYFKFASEITRPETKELIKGTEDIIRSVNEGLQQPDLTDEKIQSLIERGKQAERKLALAVTRENSGKRDLLTGKTMKTGSDFRASSATEDLNTIRAYIAKGGTVTTKTGYTFTLPKETYLYSMNRSTNPNYPIHNRPQANVGEALEEANITVKKDDKDTTGRTFIWEVTFNSSNQSHQNAYYWFTLPKDHTIGELLAATRTSNGNRSYGTSNFDAEWGGKIKEHLSVNKAVFGSANNYHFDDTVDSITDLTNVNFIAGSKQNAANNKENRFKADGRGFYYLGALYKTGGFLKDGNNGVISDSVIDKAERNLKGLKDNTDKLYLVKYDGAGPIKLRYTTTTDNKYAPLYYGAGMRSYEFSSAKHYFMARGLQEKPNAPTVTPNNEGTVTVTPYPDNDKNKNVDKVELSYTNNGAKKTVTLTRNPQNGTWTSSGDGADGIQINGNSFSLKAGSVQVGTEVKAKSYFGNSDASDERTERIRQRTATPTVTANQDGSVTVTPNGNANSLTVKYIEESNSQKTEITANKQGSTWTVTGGTNVTIDQSRGIVTIPANSVKDRSEVEAQAKATDEFVSATATATAKDQDRTAPTIRVRKNGTTTWLTPDSTGKVVVVATPERNNVELDVDIKDEANGSGYEFSSTGNNPTATKTVENSTDYNENSTTYSAWGKATDATAKLIVGLKAGKTTTDFSGITMKLNAKDKAGNITSAANKKEVTVKIVSAKPTYPEKILVGNPDNIKDAEKTKIIEKLKEANKNHPAGAPTFTKGEGNHANEIVATYSDGTTYYVPLNDVTKYEIKSKFPKGTKDLTFISGEAGNNNWGHSRDYFTYGDGTAISDSRWSSTLDDITHPFANASLTVGDNKQIEVTGPDGNGSTKKYIIDYRVVAAVTPKENMYTVKGKDFIVPNTTKNASAEDFFDNTSGKQMTWKTGNQPNKNESVNSEHTAIATVTYQGVGRDSQPITRESSVKYRIVNTVSKKAIFEANQGGSLTGVNDSLASSYTKSELGEKTHITTEEFVAGSNGITATPPSTTVAGKVYKKIKVTYDNGQTNEIDVEIRVKPNTPTVTATIGDKILSTDRVLKGTGIPKAKITVKVKDAVLKETTVQNDGTWEVTLDRGLNSNENSNVGQIVDKDSVKITQSVDNVESSEVNVKVAVGESKVHPTETTGNSVYAGAKEITVTVPHDAGAFYVQYNIAGDNRTHEVGFKRDSVNDAWTSLDTSKGIVESTAKVSDGFVDTIKITMKESVKEGNNGIRIKSNIKIGGYGSPSDWKTINVTNENPTLAATFKGEKKVVEYGSNLDPKTLVTARDKEDDKKLTIGNGTQVEIVSVNGNTTTKVVNTRVPGNYTVRLKATDSQGKQSDEKVITVEVENNHNVVAKPVINLKQDESLSPEEKRTLVELQDGTSKVQLPDGATVDVTLDTSITTNVKDVTRHATARVTFKDKTVKEVTVNYKVLRKLSTANTIYDFAGVSHGSGHSAYYVNNGHNIPDGMSWSYKKENGTEQPENTFTSTLEKDSVGTTNYTFIGKYNYGRFTNTPTDGEKLRHEETLVHKVFNVEANTTKLTVAKGHQLTAKEAESAVMKATNSDNLPAGTTYEWVNESGTPTTLTTNTAGVHTYHVKVTLPVSQTGTELPTATQVKPSKTIEVSVNVKPNAPEVTPDNNGNVKVGNANQIDVDRLEVTYTPNPTRRLQDNGRVVETDQARTTIIATKGTDNQWTIQQGARDGIDISNTGEITLKDYVVKDQTSVEAKVLTQNIASNVTTKKALNGESTVPVIGANSTLVSVGKTVNIPLKVTDDGVGVDENNIKVTNLPNGLSYDTTTKSIKGTLGSIGKHEVKVTVLDKNGNKAEKTISIAAVKPKAIYAIKDDTIKNVDNASNFVEMPTGVTLTSASWKNGQPTTTTVGNATKTVTVNANGYDATEVDVPVTVYPKVTYRKVGNKEVDTYHEIVGQPLTSRLVSGGGGFNPVTPDYYIEFEGGTKPEGTRVEFEGGTPPERSTTAGVTTKTIKVTYPDGKVTVEKTVTFKTYGNEVNYETGKDSIETIVGTSVTARNAVKLSNPNLPNPSGTAFVWWKNNGQYTPDNKIGKHTENANAWYGRTVMNARGDSTNNYNDQDITVNITVKPQAPTIAENALYGKGTTKPNVTVGNLPTNNQLETGATVTVELYSGDKKVASKTVNGGTTSVEFSKNDYTDNLTYSEKVHAVVKVAGGSGNTAYDLSSANSNDVQVTPQKPTFDTATVTSTSRTLSGTLGGFDATNRVVELHLNDENNTVLSSARTGEVTIDGDKWTATLPDTVKLRQSVAKNGETTKPSGITVENKVANTTISTTSDEKEVAMGAYSVSPTIAGSKHIDITVPHDAKRVELRFHNSTETGDKPNSITLVRGADGTWHTEATRAENATVTDANGYVGRITSTVSTTNPSENIISIPLNEQNGANKLHLKEEEANGDGTATYRNGLGLRVDYQPEAGQDPTAVGNWKVVNVTNTAPTINVKGDTGKDATHRKVYDSGTTLTADVLKDLVTVTDAEDGRATESEKPYGTGNVKVVSGLPETTGKTPAGVYEVTLTAVDSQGKEGNQVKVHVAVKEAKPTAPTVGQWQNGNLKVTPDSTNSGDKITIPLKSGNVVVTKDAQNGWQVTGQPTGVTFHNGSIEISRNLVNTTVTATASKGEGDVKAVSDPGTHTLTTHEVTKADIIKKPKESLSGTDLYSATGITGVVENGVTKTYQDAGINSVTSVGTLPRLTPDSETAVPVLITYNDGSQENTNVTLKVAPAAPNVTVNVQDGATGDVTLTIKRHDDTNYPDDSVVTVPGIDGTFKVKDGTITIKNDQLKENVQTGKVIVTEDTKLPAETAEDKEIPAKLKDAQVPTVTITQDKTTGEVTVTVRKPNGEAYANDTKVTVPGISGESFTLDPNGSFKIDNGKLPDKATSGKVKVNEPGVKPAETAEDKEIPAKKVPSATPTFTVGTQDELDGHVDVTVTGVPDGTKVKLPGVNGEKEVKDGKVTLTNDDLPEKSTKGKGIAQEEDKLPTEGTSEITIPGKLTSAKGAPAIEFRVKLPLPLVVPDPEHLTPTEIAELVKRVKEANNDEANPGKEVIADDKGNVTVTDKNTGESALLPVEDLTVKDFTPVKPTEKVPAKDILHLTPEEKKQVEDKVKAKNPGKEVTVGEDGTATVTDPNTGVSHEIPGKDLVVQDFTPVKPTEKVPVKDKAHLTPEEKKQVEDKVKAKNPGKEVTVGEDGTATVKDPTTGVSHIIPGSDLTITVGNDTTENNRPEDARPDQLPATPEVPDNSGQDTPAVTPSNDDTANNSDAINPSDDVADTENTQARPHRSQAILPNTGTAESVGFLSAAASMIAGLGFLIPFGKRRKKEEEESQND